MVKNLKAFLNDSEITEKGKFSMFGDTVDRVGIETSSAWGLLLCNLVYTSEFNWWVKNILFLRTYSPDEILSMLDDSMSQNSRSHIVSAFKNILYPIPFSGVRSVWVNASMRLKVEKVLEWRRQD